MQDIRAGWGVGAAEATYPEGRLGVGEGSLVGCACLALCGVCLTVGLGAGR